jgi:hypothetical protein
MDSKKQPPVKFYNISQMTNLTGISEKSGGRHYIPPKAKIREWAHESTEGGTARCEGGCHTQFAMYYIRVVKLKPFVIGHACLDCIREKGLQVIK